MKYDHNISPEELEQIERYLRNEMSVEEAGAFVNKMQTDDDLREKYEEIRLTVLGINESVLTGELAGYHKDIKHHKATETKARTFSWKWALAASIVFIVALSAWWVTQSADINQRIYSKYYKPDPGLMTLMSSGTSNYVFEKAMVEYKNGEYSKAIVAWTQLLKQNPGDDTLLYFTGVASQASGDYETTIRYLQTVANDEGSDFQKDACWYLGLAYLQKKDEVKAIEYFRKSEHAQSEQLIKDLTN